LLRTRLSASGQRGDSPHSREEAMVALKLDGAPQRAVQLALKNWSTQKEPTDALLLLETAKAAQHAEAESTAHVWLTETGFQHPRVMQSSRKSAGRNQ
jgi:hypothetical protein